MDLVHSVLGFYLALTLTATGLAKLKRLRPVAWSLAADHQISTEVAAVALVLLCAVELVLAMAIGLGVVIGVTAGSAVALFVLFAVYRLAMFARGNRSTCHCAGQSDESVQSLSSVLGAAASNVALAVL